ncbi:hypothetical protein ACOSQ3_025180 [Xanthoceras sorbifolium]
MLAKYVQLINTQPLHIWSHLIDNKHSNNSPRLGQECTNKTEIPIAESTRLQFKQPPSHTVYTTSLCQVMPYQFIIRQSTLLTALISRTFVTASSYRKISNTFSWGRRDSLVTNLS